MPYSDSPTNYHLHCCRGQPGLTRFDSFPEFKPGAPLGAEFPCEPEFELPGVPVPFWVFPCGPLLPGPLLDPVLPGPCPMPPREPPDPPPGIPLLEAEAAPAAAV